MSKSKILAPMTKMTAQSGERSHVGTDSAVIVKRIAPVPPITARKSKMLRNSPRVERSRPAASHQDCCSSAGKSDNSGIDLNRQRIGLYSLPTAETNQRNRV